MSLARIVKRYTNVLFTLLYLWYQSVGFCVCLRADVNQVHSWAAWGRQGRPEAHVQYHNTGSTGREQHAAVEAAAVWRGVPSHHRAGRTVNIYRRHLPITYHPLPSISCRPHYHLSLHPSQLNCYQVCLSVCLPLSLCLFTKVKICDNVYIKTVALLEIDYPSKAIM